MRHFIIVLLFITAFIGVKAQTPRLQNFSMVAHFCDKNGNYGVGYPNTGSHAHVCAGDSVYLINKSVYNISSTFPNGWGIGSRLVDGYYVVPFIGQIPSADWVYNEVISFVAPYTAYTPAINFQVRYHNNNPSSNKGASNYAFQSNYDSGNYFSALNPPVINAVNSSKPELCLGESTTLSFSGSNYSSVLWSTGETTNTIIVSPSVTTTYSVTLTNSRCSRTMDITVVVDLRITNSPNKVLISNKTYTADASITACKEIIAGNNIGSTAGIGDVVLTNTNLIYEAGQKVKLKPGFKAKVTGNKKFKALITPTCYCHPDQTANAGKDFLLCRHNGVYVTTNLYTGNPINIIGTSCTGTGKWTANPAYAISWLNNANSCVTTVTPPNSVIPPINGLEVTYTLEVDDGNGNKTTDQVKVRLFTCNPLYRTSKTAGKSAGDKAKDDSKDLTNAESTDDVFVNGLPKKGDISIFPNPASESISVSFNGYHSAFSGGPGHLLIFNSLGKVVYQSELTDESNLNVNIDISDLLPGIYYVRYDNHKSESLHGKFTKQ